MTTTPQNCKLLSARFSPVRATKKIGIAGVREVIALPLYEIMDGKDSNDYDQRVEPSVQGGSKMGTFFVDNIAALDAAFVNGSGAEKTAAPPVRGNGEVQEGAEMAAE